jgi:hypothetical protein
MALLRVSYLGGRQVASHFWYRTGISQRYRLGLSLRFMEIIRNIDLLWYTVSGDKR